VLTPRRKRCVVLLLLVAVTSTASTYVEDLVTAALQRHKGRRSLYDVAALAERAQRFQQDTCRCPFACETAAVYNNSVLFEHAFGAASFAAFQEPVPLDVSFAGQHNCQQLDGIEFCPAGSGCTPKANYVISDCDALVETTIGVGAARAAELENYTDAEIRQLLEDNAGITGDDDALWSDLDLRVVLFYELTEAAGTFSCADGCDYYAQCVTECLSSNGINATGAQDLTHLQTTITASLACTDTVSFLTPTAAPTATLEPTPTTNAPTTRPSAATVLATPTSGGGNATTSTPTTSPTSGTGVAATLAPTPTPGTSAAPTTTMAPATLPVARGSKSTSSSSSAGMLIGIVVAAVVASMLCCCLLVFGCYYCRRDAAAAAKEDDAGLKDVEATTVSPPPPQEETAATETTSAASSDDVYHVEESASSLDDDRESKIKDEDL